MSLKKKKINITTQEVTLLQKAGIIKFLGGA